MLRALLFGILTTQISPVVMEDDERYQDICSQEPRVGRCRASIPMWYHDKQQRTCQEFVYGGCGGNGNKFETKEDCEFVCIPPGSAIPVDQLKYMKEQFSSNNKDNYRQPSIRDETPSMRFEETFVEDRPQIIRDEQPIEKEGLSQKLMGKEGPSQQAMGKEWSSQQLMGKEGPSQQAMGKEWSSQQLMGKEGPSQQPMGKERPSQEPMGKEGPSQEPMGKEGPSQQPMGKEGPSQEPMGKEGPSQEIMGKEGPSQEPMGKEGPSHEPMGKEGPSQQPMGKEGPSQQPMDEGDTIFMRPNDGKPATAWPDIPKLNTNSTRNFPGRETRPNSEIHN